MCNSLKIGQQMTLSRTVGDYTTILWISLVWDHWNSAFWKTTSRYFLIHSCLEISILWLDSQLWMHYTSTVSPHRWLGSKGIKAKAMSSLDQWNKPITKGNLYLFAVTLENNALNCLHANNTLQRHCSHPQLGVHSRSPQIGDKVFKLQIAFPPHHPKSS